MNTANNVGQMAGRIHPLSSNGQTRVHQTNSVRAFIAHLQCVGKLVMLLLTLTLMPWSLDAAALPADSKVLIIGPAADIHETALEGLIAGDSTADSLNITIDSFATNDLLLAYFEGTPESKDWYGLRKEPGDSNALLAQLDQNYDLILIHPSERHIRLCPELHMEAVRLVERHVRSLGSRIALLVPSHDPAYPKDSKNPTDATMLKERVYRIKDALELECIPVGMCWETVLQDGQIAAVPTSIATPNTHAVNVYATTIFSALFESSAAQSTFRHGGIGDVEFSLISAHAFQTWQDALSATHYSGDYVGIFSPFPSAYDPLTKKPASGGASTENLTREELGNIYRRKGIAAVNGDGGRDISELGPEHDFYINRGHMSASLMNYYRSLYPDLADLRYIGQEYKGEMKNMIAWALSTRNDDRDWYDTSNTFVAHAYGRYSPNFLAYARHWLEGDFQLPRHGDSHLNANATMIQSALIYTMVSGGEHPMAGAIDMDAWTGPQRYAAGLGYATIMGIGRLKKLEMAPVAMANPRYYMTANAANPLELPGIDFNGLPVSVEIVTPPANGSLVPAGDGFTYTPANNFSGLDSVTYRVTNGSDTSYPLTVMLPVNPYIPAQPTGTVIFADDFDDQNIDDWQLTGEAFFVTADSSTSLNVVTFDDAFPQPYDGIASLWLTGSGGSVEQTIDTSDFENLKLTVRVGSGARLIRDPIPDKAKVEWFDGSTWHTLVSHGHTYATNRLMLTYDFDLPPEAAGNPQFALRLWGKPSAPGKYWIGAYFDSVCLSGDFNGSTRVVSLAVTNAESDLNLNEANGSGSVVKDGDGQWTVTTTGPLGTIGTLLLEFVLGSNG